MWRFFAGLNLKYKRHERNTYLRLGVAADAQRIWSNRHFAPWGSARGNLRAFFVSLDSMECGGPALIWLLGFDDLARSVTLGNR